MTRDVEVELSIWEMLLAAKNHWIMVLLIAVLCAALGGVFGYVRQTGTGDEDASGRQEAIEEIDKQKEHNEVIKTLFDENKKLRETSDELYEAAAEQLRNEWKRLSEQKERNPFANIDPLECSSSRLTILFEKKTGNHLSMVYDWIQGADDKALFGDAASDLSEFKNDLITVGSGTSGADEAVLTVYDADGCDADKVIDYLKNYITSKSAEIGIKVQGTTTSHSTGYNSHAYDVQQSYVSRLSAIQDSLDSIYERISTVVEEPQVEEPQIEEVAEPVPQSGPSMSIILAIFIVIHKGCVLSMRQVEDTFGLERLGNLAKGEDVSLEVLNSNLDVLIGNDKSVMILGSSADDPTKEYADKWNSQGSRKFVAGKDLINDSATIDALSDVEGILLGVVIGKSKHSDIQGVLIRANKLGKNVLGYVVI